MVGNDLGGLGQKLMLGLRREEPVFDGKLCFSKRRAAGIDLGSLWKPMAGVYYITVGSAVFLLHLVLKSFRGSVPLTNAFKCVGNFLKFVFFFFIALL